MPRYTGRWAEIEAGQTPSRGEFRVYTTECSTAEGPALLAVDAQGTRHILLPVRSGVRVEGDERSSGVQILMRDLIDSGETSTFVDVVCRKPHLFSVFEHFGEELLDAVGAEPGRPGTIARRTLNRWRELFDRAAPGVLGPDQIAGLYGELHILRRLVEHSPEAIDAWTGSEGARFDFQARSNALEVKTSTVRDELVVEIHGVDQMQAPQDGELFVAAVGLERLASGESLPDLVDAIRVAGIDNARFSAKLRSAGYNDGDAQHYAADRFVVRQVELFRVDESFPRIVRSSFVGGDLPPGVSRLQYTVRLGSLPALNDQEVQAALALFAAA